MNHVSFVSFSFVPSGGSASALILQRYRIATVYVIALIILAGPVAALGQSQPELNEQADNAYQAADKKLNEIYRSLRARISPAGKTALQNAEQSWVRFRDQECAFETMGSADGSIHPMVVSECLAELTRERTKALGKQLDCPEGDVACGGQ